jgi:hypothetical protein
MMGTGTGIGPANQAVFWDKEWLTVDNNPSSPRYGRAYLTATRFLNDLHGNYAESPIYISHSDDGGVTWSEAHEISGSHPSCTFQMIGGANECDEDQFSIPEVASNGILYVHFLNGQNDAAWEVADDFDSGHGGEVTDGGTFALPGAAEDGLSDCRSVIRRQTVWGHQIAGRLPATSPSTVRPDDDGCLLGPRTRTLNDCRLLRGLHWSASALPGYDPCGAGPGLTQCTGALHRWRRSG